MKISWQGFWKNNVSTEWSKLAGIVATNSIFLKKLPSQNVRMKYMPFMAKCWYSCQNCNLWKFVMFVGQIIFSNCLKNWNLNGHTSSEFWPFFRIISVQSLSKDLYNKSFVYVWYLKVIYRKPIYPKLESASKNGHRRTISLLKIYIIAAKKVYL